MPLVFGKRGATPPLPRNCKRGEQGRARRGGQPLDGDRLGRCAKLNRCASQETGQGHVLRCLSVSMGGPKGARSSPISAGRRFPGFQVWLYGFAARFRLFAKVRDRPALGCRLSRLAYYFHHP